MKTRPALQELQLMLLVLAICAMGYLAAGYGPVLVSNAAGLLQGRVAAGTPVHSFMENRLEEAQHNLEQVYQSLSRRLDEIPRDKLGDAQTKWQAYSLAECEFSAHYSAEEPLHRQSYTECLLGMTEERQQQLQNELDWRFRLEPDLEVGVRE